MSRIMQLAMSLLCLSLVAVKNFGDAAKPSKDVETIVEYRPGNCKEKADNGDTVSVHYTGTLENGQMFDTSLSQGRKPISFELGKGQVIKGWEQGIKGMCVGEKRKLVIPSHLGYGSRGVQNVIPPDSTLIFTTELVALQKRSMFKLGPLLFILPWPVLAGMLLYYLYKKATAPVAKKHKEGQIRNKKGRKKN